MRQALSAASMTPCTSSPRMPQGPSRSDCAALPRRRASLSAARQAAMSARRGRPTPRAKRAASPRLSNVPSEGPPGAGAPL